LMMLSACGLSDPTELRPEILNRRISHHEVRNYAELFPQAPPGSLLEGNAPEFYQRYWDAADAGRF